MLIDSLRAPVEVWDAKAIDASPQLVGIKGSPTWVRAIASPQVHRAGPKWDAGQGVSDAVSQALDALFADDGFCGTIPKGWEMRVDRALYRATMALKEGIPNQWPGTRGELKLPKLFRINASPARYA